MADSPNEFETLMERVRAGCPEAAREVFARYSGAVRRVVRRTLHQKMRRQYDSVDFLQSVWASFFLVPAQSYTFATQEALVGFLSRVAFNKVVEATRRQLGTDKRDAGRERSLDDADLPEIPLHGPTPSQVAMAAECWEGLLRDQPPELRRVLELLRQGHNHKDIAQQLGLHPKVIQRLIKKLSPEADLP
jgi:RNA polymerase sigma-70 factor (ECF subfamily)